jgi:hypothetical protein
MTMVARRDPVDRVVDLIVAVPVSLAALVREIVPVDTGRIERAIGRNLHVIGRYAARGSAPAETETAQTHVSESPVMRAGRADDPAVPSTGGSAQATDDPIGTAASDLPIEGYDQLSARQIVDRLDSLTDTERAHVESYERANRRRQTVLGRIGQLS